MEANPQTATSLNNPEKPPSSMGCIFDQLLTFTGPSQEFAALLLASAFSSGMLRQGAIFNWNEEKKVPGIECSIPPLSPNAIPEWLQGFFTALPAPSADLRTTIIPRDDHQGSGDKRSNRRGIKPLAAGEPVFLAFEMMNERQEEMPAFMLNLEMLGALWRAYQRRMRGDSSGDAEILAPALSVLSAVNCACRFKQFAMSLCNELASRFRCDRVSLGLLKGRYVRMAAMNHTEKFSKGMELVQSIESAMEECLDQDVEILHPAPADSTFISRAAAELSGRFGEAWVMSVPVRRANAAYAVLTLERSSSVPPDARDIKLLRLIADLVAPRLAELHRHDRWCGARLAGWTREKLAMVFGPKHTWAKLASLACLGAAAYLAVARGEYRVEATFVSQPVEQRVLAAPYDGFIAAVHVRPGDRLDADDTLLASMETAELQSRLAMKKAEALSHRKDAATARREKKFAEEQAAEARVEQANTECSLLEAKLAQADIYSPLSGVILSGDWTRKVGAPVKQGDTLFEVAALARMEADLYVPEDEIADVHEGQTGELAAAGRPDEKIRFQVIRITPLAELVKQKNVFRVQVRLVDPPDWMLPGLEGVAKIDVEERLLIRIWTRRAVNWIKMKIWSWWWW